MTQLEVNVITGIHRMLLCMTHGVVREASPPPRDLPHARARSRVFSELFEDYTISDAVNVTMQKV